MNWIHEPFFQVTLPVIISLVLSMFVQKWGFDEIDKRLDEIARWLDHIEAKLDNIEGPSPSAKIVRRGCA